MITRLDIAKEVAVKESISIQNAYSLIGTVVDVIAESLGKDNVQLSGLGTFKRVILQPREGRNPRTGESIQIPKRTVVRFKPAKGLASSNGKKTSKGNTRKNNGRQKR
jgi:nucleoid DNA-binding protein